MDFLSLGLSAAEGLIGSAVGIAEMVQGNKMAKRNVRPKLGNLAVDNYQDLLGLFDKQAQYGIDPSALSFVSNKDQDALAATLQSMLLAGANPNSVGSAYASFADAMGQLGVQDSEKRWQKIQQLVPVTQGLVDAKLQRFLYDVDAPYKDIAQAAAAKQNAGLKTLTGSIDSTLGNIAKIAGANPLKPPKDPKGTGDSSQAGLPGSSSGGDGTDPFTLKSLELLGFGQ